MAQQTELGGALRYFRRQPSEHRIGIGFGLHRVGDLDLIPYHRQQPVFCEHLEQPPEELTVLRDNSHLLSKRVRRNDVAGVERPPQLTQGRTRVRSAQAVELSVKSPVTLECDLPLKAIDLRSDRCGHTRKGPQVLGGASDLWLVESRPGPPDNFEKPSVDGLGRGRLRRGPSGRRGLRGPSTIVRVELL